MPESAATALSQARELLHPPQLRATAATRHGYLDVLGEATAPAPTFAQRAMNSRTVAALYERVWRPAWVSFTGLTHTAERTQAIADLRLDGAQYVLDVACGPGNFTRHLASALREPGLAVGFDISAPMLAQAVTSNSAARTAYVRGDARRLPFDDNTFTAVCCYGALYLMPQPFTVITEMVRVLAPGGRIAVMATARPNLPGARQTGALTARVTGVTTFERDAFTAAFARGGLTDIEIRVHRLVQFVTATKPAS